MLVSPINQQRYAYGKFCMKIEEIRSKKIAVIGAGGVGGYIAGMLGKSYPHITMCVRGKRLEAIRENGFTLHSEYNGNITFIPENVVSIDEMEPQDYIFICVKNYSLDEVCRSIKPIITDNTVVVPVMNGVDPGERVRRILGKGIVVESLIYIIAFANKDYSVTQQGNFATVKIGINNADLRETHAVNDVAAIMSGSGIDCQIADDITLEIWRKYILNCGYNVATAYYNNTIGELRCDPVKSQEFETLLEEAHIIANAKHIGITQAHIDEIIYKFYNVWADDATSSLQRDVSACKISELDTFSGYIVREADRLGIDIPISQKMYEGLNSGASQIKDSSESNHQI